MHLIFPKKTFLTYLLVIAVLSGLYSSCNNQKVEGSPEFSTEDYQLTVPDFPEHLKWLNTDSSLSLTDFKGKFVLLDFWTYCCINCLHVIPDLQRLEEEFPQLVIIGVHSAKFHNEQVLDNVKQAIVRYEVNHPVVADNKYEVWNSFNIKAWPSFILIDPLGNELGHISGEGPYKRIAPGIEKLTAELKERNVIDFERRHFDLVKDEMPDELLKYPGKITADQSGKRLFISDSNNDRILVVNKDGNILNVIGSGSKGSNDGLFIDASFNRPQRMAYDKQMNLLYIADTENHIIRIADLNSEKVQTILGTGKQSTKTLFEGTGTSLFLNSPWDLVLLNDHLYIAMAGSHQVWSMDTESFHAKAVIGSGSEKLMDGFDTNTSLAQPSGITTDGRDIYFVDSETSSLRSMFNLQPEDLTMNPHVTLKTLIGQGLFDFGDFDGDIAKARMQHPLGVLYHDNKLYITDTYNHKIRYYDPSNKQLHSLVGGPKSGFMDGSINDDESPKFNEPSGITFLDGKFYITDTNNHRIRIYDPELKKVSTFEIKYSSFNRSPL